MVGSERARYEYLSIANATDFEIVAHCIEYFNSEAAGYDEFDSKVKRRAEYLHSIENHVIENLSKRPRCESIVSFGCGTGRREVRILNEIPHKPRMLGIDKSAAMRRLAGGRGLEVSAKLDTLQELNGTVDVILALYSFSHLPSRNARMEALRLFRMALKKDGILMLDVFNLHDKFEWESKIADGGLGVGPPQAGPNRGDVLYRRVGRPETSYMHYFTVGEIAELVESAGFTISTIEGVGHGGRAGVSPVPFNEGCLFLACEPV